MLLTALAGAATVVRNGSRVRNLCDANTSCLNSPNRTLAASAGALHPHFALMHTLGNGNASRILSHHRGGKCGRLARALEPSLTGRAPADNTTAGVSNGNLRVIERGTDESDARRNRLSALFLCNLAFRGRSCDFGGRFGLSNFFAHFKNPLLISARPAWASQWKCACHPYECERWSSCAGHGREAPSCGGDRDRNQSG